jgi:hypothetical protein
MKPNKKHLHNDTEHFDTYKQSKTYDKALRVNRKAIREGKRVIKE